MKMKSILLFTTLVLLFVSATVADTDKFTVKCETGELTIAPDGISLTPLIQGSPSSVATGENWWSIVLESAPGVKPEINNLVLQSADQEKPKIKQIRDGVKLTYGPLSSGKKIFDVYLMLSFKNEDSAFKITGEIRNRTEEWVVKGFTGPVFNGIQTDINKTPVLIPKGMGWRINRVPVKDENAYPWAKQGADLRISAEYPSARGTMQWFAYAGESAGLYFGCHDPEYTAKTLSVRYDPERETFGAAFQHQIFIRPGESRDLPPMIVMPYIGDWHVAARTYREWVDSAGDFIEKPAWAKTATGWLLAILKQQNGDIMWPYDTLGKLADVADERGLDILGLFGWGYGGHDHLYPEYNPCPLMGGENALRKGIEDAHARSKRVVLYANGQLEERGTAYWTRTGRHIAVTSKDGSTVQEFWHKYGNTPGYHFDIGCHATEAWRERMLALAMQANEFGADGILYDQLGMRAPTPCYAENHGHKVPFMSYEADRKEMLREIARKMKKINPEFVIMTEGFHDAILDSISYFHGCIEGCFQDTAKRVSERETKKTVCDLFPEMLRYTYPELATTVRFPSPLMDRDMVNYTCVFGWRYEIESRYIPDRDYLQDGKIPETEDYSVVKSKPNISLMQNLPFKETAAYMKKVASFQKKHADLLMGGCFNDTEGFCFEGKGIIAKRFSSGEKTGVILWNTTDKPAVFKLSISDAQVVSAEEPGIGVVQPYGQLAPHSLRLLVCKKKEMKKMKCEFVNAFGYTDCVEMRNNAGVRVVLCPDAGGRILEYSYEGQNALYVDSKQNGWHYQAGVTPVDPCGGRFDIGPERVITPHPDLWLGDWTAEISGDGEARLTSPKDSALGIRLVRTFTLAQDSSRLICRQEMINESDKPVSCCHWSRTLAAGGGICLIPLTPDSRFPKNYIMYGPESVMYYQPEDANIRVRDGFLEVLGTPLNPKLGLDSSAGWFCYLLRNNLMFIKRFPVYPDRVYSEMAGLTISIWYYRNLMCELEPIGPGEMIEPGKSASYTEEWELLSYDFPKEGETVDLEKIKEKVNAS